MPFGVVPKTDCPHLNTHFKRAGMPTEFEFPVQCAGCKNESENWICLRCYAVNCSRHVNGHAQAHFDSSKHAVAVSCTDLSVWCYECDSYITHPLLSAFLTVLTKAKFDETRALSESSASEDDLEVEQLEEMFRTNAALAKAAIAGKAGSGAPVTKARLASLDLKGVAEFIKAGHARNIIVMTGAGISVAAGIPDFRTPGTGLYDNLQKYNLPTPTAVFDIEYFRTKPEPFYLLAKELYPGNYRPTKTHYFVRLLHEKKLLLRNFTQNIDTLERVAGIPGNVLVEAHGSFAAAHCISCHAEEDEALVRASVMRSSVHRCSACAGLVKPDIVFFGEPLPPLFFKHMVDDFPKCDLLLVFGTSLQVHPFAGLINKVPADTPRVLVNREMVGKANPVLDLIFGKNSEGFRFGMANNDRDVAHIGDLLDGIDELVAQLGWTDELNALIASHNATLPPSNNASSNNNNNTTTTNPNKNN